MGGDFRHVKTSFDDILYWVHPCYISVFESFNLDEFHLGVYGFCEQSSSGCDASVFDLVVMKEVLIMFLYLRALCPSECFKLNRLFVRRIGRP